MEKRLINEKDLLQLNFVGDPQVSPDKQHTAYVLTKMDEEKNGYYSSIYVTDMDGKSECLTALPGADKIVKDTTPKWSPDGKLLAFLSDRSGKSQVWAAQFPGDGTLLQLTDCKDHVTDFTWSPDGKTIALVVDENTNDADENEAKVITRLRYKADGISEFLFSRKHIYIFDVTTKSYTKVTEGDFDHVDPSFSPDGKTLLYTAAREEDYELNQIPSIWKFDLNDKEESLFYKGKGPISSVTFSPNGKWVAFISHEHGELSPANLTVWVQSVENGVLRNVSKALDRSVDNVIRVDASYDTGKQRVIWNETSSEIYFTAMDHGSILLYKTNLDGNVSAPLSEAKHTITSFDLVDDNKAILVQAHAHSTGDLVIQYLDQRENTKQLTNWNDELFNEVKLSTPEHIQFTSLDDLEIEGWVLPPTKENNRAKSPLVLQIHGGPHSAYGYGFQHEWQLMAAKGYYVLYMNPRGSQSYGEEFTNQVVDDWGGKDYHDLMNGVDYVLKQYPSVDENQMFATGISYGGYMTNMISTRTERFKAVATQNSVTNLYSMFGTSDIGFFFNSYELGGADQWEDEDKIMALSPIRYANKVKTPTLVLHNETDYRCPMEQGEQWYMALRRLGVETKMVRFPNEDHGSSSHGKPKHRLERLHYLIDWFESFRD